MAQVILFGLTEMSEMLHFYLTHDSTYQVAAFTVDEKYLTKESFCGLPVIPFETIEMTHPPEDFYMGINLGFRQVNKLRAKKYSEAKAKGYELISYVSSKAITWPDLAIGENSIITEAAVVQPRAKIGNNVMISPGTIVGHHSVIHDHCFIAAGAVLLGHVIVEPFCVLGANCTIKDGITIRRECIISAGSYISEDTREKGIYITKPAELIPRSSDEMSRLLTWAEDVRRTKSKSS